MSTTHRERPSPISKPGMLLGSMVLIAFASILLLRLGSDAANSTDVLGVTPAQRTEAWWLARHEQKLAELHEQEAVDLLMIGDSITHFWETFGKDVWKTYYGKRNAVNLGFSGDRTEHVLWRLENGSLDGISPKLVVLMIGTNNTGHRQPRPAATAAGIKAIIDTLAEKLPTARILLLPIFPRGDSMDGSFRRINERVNQLITSYGDDPRVTLLDVGPAFLDDDGNVRSAVMPDLLHLNAQGYEIWAREMESTISSILGDSPVTN